MVTMRYDDKVAPDFEHLVKLLPPKAVASPLRSTLPLVDFWRTPESRLAQLSAAIGVALDPPIELCFEFPVPVQRGRGNSSYTDLMIIASSAAVAIEAKLTEPRYQTAGDWLRDPPGPNRSEVLEGWLHLIRDATGTALSVRDVTGLPYQLIHRTASVCSVLRPIRAVVYQVFEEGLPEPYVRNLAKLWGQLGRSTAISFHVLSCPLYSLPTHDDLVKRWKQRNHPVGDALRTALLTGTLFSFGKPASQSVPG
jgi:hypothetical protein